MSFESLVKKLMKEGKSKTAATKIAGSVANAKMKGAGSGPTAKQKARAKSPAQKKRKGMKIQGAEPDKKSSYTDKKGKTVELKRYKSKEYKRTTDPDATKETIRATRRTNTLELSKTKTKKDGTTKTKVKRAAGGTKKAERLTGQFKKGAKKEGASDIKIKTKSIATMKKSKTTMKKSKKKVEQDYARNAIADYKAGKKKEAKYEKKKALEVAAGESPAKMKKPVTKTKITTDKGTKVKNKLKKGTIKVKIKSPSGSKRKFVVNTNMESLNPSGRQTLSDPNKYKSRKAARKANSPAELKNPSKKRAKLIDKVEKLDNLSSFRGRTGNLKPRKNEGSEKKQNKRMDKGFAKADKKMSKVMAIDSAAKMKKNPMMMKSNQDGGAYAAKNLAAPARQLKKLGSVLSKHFKSNR